MLSSSASHNTPEIEVSRRDFLGIAAATSALSLVSDLHANCLCAAHSNNLPSAHDTSTIDIYHTHAATKVSFAGPYQTPSSAMELALCALFKSFADTNAGYQMVGDSALACHSSDEIGIARREEIRRAVWIELQKVSEFELQNISYSADAYDRFLMSKLPAVLSQRGIFMLPYLELIAEANSDKFSHAELRAEFYSVESAQICEYEDRELGKQFIETVIISGPFLGGGQQLTNGSPFSAITAWDTIFARRDSATNMANEFASEPAEFRNLSNEFVAKGYSDAYAACCDWVANTSVEQKNSVATFAAMYLAHRGLISDPLTVEAILATNFAHEAGHIFAFRRGAKFNFLDTSRIDTHERALREEYNRATHHEVCGYFRQLQHGRMDLTLFGFLQAINTPSAVATLQHLAAKQSILAALEQNFMQNAQTWQIPIRNDPRVPTQLQIRMMLPLVAVQQPESFAGVVSRLAEDHLLNGDNQNWGNIVVDILKRDIEASKQRQRQTGLAVPPNLTEGTSWLRSPWTWLTAGLATLVGWQYARRPRSDTTPTRKQS